MPPATINASIVHFKFCRERILFRFLFLSIARRSRRAVPKSWPIEDCAAFSVVPVDLHQGPSCTCELIVESYVSTRIVAVHRRHGFVAADDHAAWGVNEVCFEFPDWPAAVTGAASGGRLHCVRRWWTWDRNADR